MLGIKKIKSWMIYDILIDTLKFYYNAWYNITVVLTWRYTEKKWQFKFYARKNVCVCEHTYYQYRDTNLKIYCISLYKYIFTKYTILQNKQWINILNNNSIGLQTYH